MSYINRPWAPAGAARILGAEPPSGYLAPAAYGAQNWRAIVAEAAAQAPASAGAPVAPSTAPSAPQATVYALIDRRDGHCYYVGRSLDPRRRIRQHLNMAAKGHLGAVYVWLRTVPTSELLVDTLAVVAEAEGQEVENFWIAALRRQGQPLQNDPATPLIPEDARPPNPPTASAPPPPPPRSRLQGAVLSLGGLVSVSAILLLALAHPGAASPPLPPPAAALAPAPPALATSTPVAAAARTLASVADLPHVVAAAPAGREPVEEAAPPRAAAPTAVSAAPPATAPPVVVTNLEGGQVHRYVQQADGTWQQETPLPSDLAPLVRTPVTLRTLLADRNATGQGLSQGGGAAAAAEDGEAPPGYTGQTAPPYAPHFAPTPAPTAGSGTWGPCGGSGQVAATGRTGGPFLPGCAP